MKTITPHMEHMRTALRHARLNKGLTQEQAAERLGISRVWMSTLETGSRDSPPSPSLALLTKMAQVYGVSYNELLGHKTKKKKEHRHGT